MLKTSVRLESLNLFPLPHYFERLLQRPIEAGIYLGLTVAVIPVPTPRQRILELSKFLLQLKNSNKI